jgi:hypothetical protein
LKARREHWELDLLIALRAAIDLGVYNGTVDLDGDSLLGFADVGELCLLGLGPTGETELSTRNFELRTRTRNRERGTGNYSFLPGSGFHVP